MTGTTVTQATDPAADAASLLNLIAGGAMTQIVHAVAALNIADHLAGEPRTAKEVAAREGSNERTTFRLMRAAASLGLLSYEGEGRFGLTGMGGLLRSDTPVSLRPMALVQAAPSHWQPWGLFPEAVRKGESQAGKALGADIFDYYARPENAEMARIFSEAMGGMSAMVTQGVVAGADLEGVSTVVDVGGADGHLVLALMEARPELRGQVLDLPHAVEGAVEEAARRGLSDRFSGAAGDFFAEVPTADLHVLKTVLHDWDDDRALRILRNCRAAAGEGGRALVVEMVLKEVGTSDFATVSDMAMLCVTGGVERDLDEFDALFTAAGWSRGRTYPVGGGHFGMELRAV
ncbi:methyltransferase [Streptomyces griseoaurantiacus]|uniref:methyltransferase n=1 Tax=Streptomyces griseoaurantiacus TaxID=68213 RepID=UPI003F1AF5C9